VQALAHLPHAHLAVLTVTAAVAARRLREVAERAGVADRLHLLDQPPPDEALRFLATADLGLIPARRSAAHDVALPAGLFDYLQAGVPVLVSDCPAQAELVRALGVGGVHASGDAGGLAQEARRLLAEAPGLRARIMGLGGDLQAYGWARQAEALRGLYADLLGHPAQLSAPHVSEPGRSDTDAASRPLSPAVVGIGPANFAGQAWAWARAVERELPGAQCEVVAMARDTPLVFPADLVVKAATFAADPAWAAALEERASATWTHALLEAGRPMFGHRHGRTFAGDVPVMRAAGITVGLVMHGSEARNPARHARTTPWSPFRDPNEELTAALQRQWEVTSPLVDAFDGPVFVSTPDLLDDVRGGIWLPLTVDMATWRANRPVLERDVPVVLHAPSRASLKGTTHVRAALEPLAAAGLIELRLLEGVSPSQMPAAIADADLVLDQFALGSYGAMAAQAMAAGRITVGHVLPAVREHVRAACGVDVPVVEATPDTLAQVVRRLLTEPDQGRRVAAEALAFAGSAHDGRFAVRVLDDHLGLSRGR
jgi:glycosyltransferase involved in cell wall biosynthesis